MNYLKVSLFHLAATVGFGQNINQLFEEFPGASENCQIAFESAELEWESEILDNGEEFKRVVSWIPGGTLKYYSNNLDQLQAYIERSSENNSFSLNAPPSIDNSTIKTLEELALLRSSIVSLWEGSKVKQIGVNIDFIVPNELNNSCEQIQESINELNSAALRFNANYGEFYGSAKISISQFQDLFSMLNKLKHPMVNNQCLDELSNVMSILMELNSMLNYQYKNMVESRMALNNAMCK